MDDVLGWQKTRWGMTTLQVIEAVGKEHLRKQPREGGEKDGWYCDLIIENLDIGNHWYLLV
jgi:hypothetical protein